MSPSLIQIVELKGYEPVYNTVVFDASGKQSCRDYFDSLCKLLQTEMYVYYNDYHFKETEPYTYREVFLKLVGGELAPANNFDDCHFYERHFYTANHDREDQGIVCFFSYSVLNSGRSYTR